MRVFLFFICAMLMTMGGVLADPPMKVVYSSTSSTNFSWTWPYHIVQKWTVVQNYPLPPGYGWVNGKIVYITSKDVSYYRYHNPQLTYNNEWGYFFPPHTRPIKVGGVVYFVAPYTYSCQTR